MAIDDGRGYIEVYNEKKVRIGYIGDVSYGDFSYTVVDDLDCARKYMQEDLLFHDTIFLQGYCFSESHYFVPKMPFSYV
jgi:hypothetical protein